MVLSLTADITPNAREDRILQLLVSESARLLNSLIISLLIAQFAKVCHAEGRHSDLLKRWLIVRLAYLFHARHFRCGYGLL